LSRKKCTQPQKSFLKGYSALGREDEAREEVATILKLNPRLSLGYLAKTLPYKNQADLEKVLNDLRKAGLK